MILQKSPYMTKPQEDIFRNLARMQKSVKKLLENIPDDQFSTIHFIDYKSGLEKALQGIKEALEAVENEAQEME